MGSELHEIRTARRTDPKTYTPEVEKRELGLLAHIQNRGMMSAAASLIGEAAEPLKKVGAELAETQKARRADFAAYRKDEAMQARELELLGQRDALPGGVKTHEGLAAVVAPVLETAADQAAFEGAFDEMYSAHPETGQEAMRAVISGDVIEPSRPASEARVQAFAGFDIGGDLLKEWGHHAPRKLAMVRASVEQMVSRGGDLAWRSNGSTSFRQSRPRRSCAVWPDNGAITKTDTRSEGPYMVVLMPANNPSAGS